jgi:hypothetical protein
MQHPPYRLSAISLSFGRHFKIGDGRLLHTFTRRWHPSGGPHTGASPRGDSPWVPLDRNTGEEVIATGDLIQVPDEERITARLIFHFKDGSIEDETTVFSQRKTFRLISDHLVEKGPSFPDPVDMSLDVASGNVTVHRTDGAGKDRTDNYHFDFPPDLANGLVLTLLKNIPGTPLKQRFLFSRRDRNRCW